MSALPPGHVCILLLVKQTWYQEGFPMNMNGQSRTFVKQVKLDLLALSDADLFQVIQRWVEVSGLCKQPLDKAENICLALGYTRELSDTEHHSPLTVNIPAVEIENPASWNAPDPHQ